MIVIVLTCVFFPAYELEILPDKSIHRGEQIGRTGVSVDMLQTRH